MKKLLYNILILILGVVVTACSDFLDKEPNNYSTTGFYKSEAALKDGVAGVYNGLYKTYSEFYNLPFPVAMAHTTAMALPRGENTTISAGGALNPDNLMVREVWFYWYTMIARANSLIYGSKDYIDGLNEKSHQYWAEAKVLRAYAYYNLISLYGDIPFYTEPVTIDQYKDARVSKVTVLDFILSELDEAAGYMPWIATEQGRVDKAVAYGLKARAALLGGSLNYGGKGTEYFKTAAEAAKQVIGQRQLAKNFDDLFNLTGQAKSDARNEIMFAIMYSGVGTIKTHNIAFGQVSRNSGQTGRHPSMLLADTYECIDGKRIDESPYYDPKHPQRNRDPRFHSTLWMHGDTVTVNNGSIYTQVLEAYSAEMQKYDYGTNQWTTVNNADINSAAAWASFCNAGCGYIWAKFSNETTENIASQTCNVPLMRYAEVLLTYAEAKIELNELDQSVYDAINQVRERAGMPKVSDDRIGNQDKMRQLVRRERKVELAIEGLHPVDMRRWGTGDLENGQPSYGLPLPTVRYEGMSATDRPNFKTSARADLNDIPNYDAYKNKIKVRDVNRYWDKKFELWPIPQLERDRNPNLTQNDGY